MGMRGWMVQPHLHRHQLTAVHVVRANDRTVATLT